MASNQQDESIFSYRFTKDGKVFIEWNRKTVKILKGTSGERFLEKMESATYTEKQMIMAKATGNFKRGNEKSSRNR